MSALRVVLAVLMSGVAIGIKKAIEVTVEREYLGWASGLARMCVRLAGFICRSHQAQWRSDLLFIQKEEGRTGLPEALGCVVAAPRLAVHARVVARKHQPFAAFEYPAGDAIYESLETRLVDFPVLLKTLRNESFTGYVKLLADEAAGHVIFVNGVDREYAYRAVADQRHGDRANLALLKEVARGNGTLDIIATR